MGRKCGVESCLSDSARLEDTGVTFHKVPMHPDIRPKWMSLCRIPEDKKDVKVIYICSRHFLRADFCNFKGKKYMLKQGVLPSVFPWTKVKSENPEDFKPLLPVGEPDVTVKTELPDETMQQIKLEPDDITIKEEPQPPETERMPVTKTTQSTTIEQKVKTVQTTYGLLNFAINSRIEALDFNNMWFPARIVEIDYEENEVLIHFEKYSSKYDEWICMDSARLRPLQPAVKKGHPRQVFGVGDRCMASWNDTRKFPATISKVIDHDTYEVIFDDGFVKILKSNRITKRTMQSSPLFDPVQGSKQERRDKKRKLNVATLFNKRSRSSVHDEKSMRSPHRHEQDDSWTPRWENDRPLGVDSSIETNDGTRKSVIVPDPRLPPGWVKHLTQRLQGASAGKWDTIIVSPEGRRFRTRTEIRAYIDDNPSLCYTHNMFDFGLHRRFSRRSTHKSVANESAYKEMAVSAPADAIPEPAAGSSTEEEESINYLKIPVVDGGYQCPIEGCAKIFRKENLAQMHVKHYHPEYTKFLDFTPNVADLAYARTVGEALDRSPGPAKPAPVPRVSKPPVAKVGTPKAPSPIVDDNKPQTGFSKNKDSEIIKLLNSKPFDGIRSEDGGGVTPLPSGLPLNMYPDIKLRDLLNKSEGIPKRDDLNLKSLSASTTRPTGIKTLLPVVRTSSESGRPGKVDVMTKTPKSTAVKHGLKRKRIAAVVSEVAEPKPIEVEHRSQGAVEVVPAQLQPPPQPGNVIIEGGEVIKIVQMKREEIINCTCGITEEDGLMIQCELCLCWQHAYCNNIERENQVPEKYVCYICQNPARQRLSRKYFHDQDWLKVGTLPTASFHSKDEEVLGRRFERLKKTHDISGGLLELKDYVHTLKVKIKIAETKNHPKLYQWSKPWEKLPLPEKMEERDEAEVKPKQEQSSQNDSMLFSILKSGKEEQKIKEEFDMNSLMDPMTAAPQPEAAIDSAVCKVNLVEHIAHSQSLVEERLDDFEAQLNALDVGIRGEESDEDFPRMRQTLQMLIRDLNTLKQLSQVNSL